MKTRLFLFIFIVFTLLSCSKTEDVLKTGGTWKVTASSGTTKTMNLKTEGILGIGSFWCSALEVSNYSGLTCLELSGYVDAGQCRVQCYFSNPVITGIDYSLQNVPKGRFIFTNWVSDLGVTNTTLKFSNFNNPGRVTGVITNYDKNGSVLSKGEFDFIVLKPQVLI
ncbi:MAG: hypothetical protein WCJ61_04785 [Paludibacter sp.]